MTHLRVYKDDADYDGGVRRSCARFRTLLTELCTVLVLRDAFEKFFVICTCRFFGPKRGECPHETKVRYLQGDPAVNLGPLRLLRLGEGPQSAQGAAAARREQIQQRGRPAGSQGNPLSTLDEIVQRAKMRAEARKAQANSVAVAVNELFQSPHTRVVVSAGAGRHADLARLRKRLLSQEFRLYFMR